jgi:hypothetical protein
MHLLASARAFYNTNCRRIEHDGWTNGLMLEVGNRIVLLPSPHFATLSQYFLLYLTPGLVDAPTCFRLCLLQHKLRVH